MKSLFNRKLYAIASITKSVLGLNPVETNRWFRETGGHWSMIVCVGNDAFPCLRVLFVFFSSYRFAAYRLWPPVLPINFISHTGCGGSVSHHRGPPCSLGSSLFSVNSIIPTTISSCTRRVAPSLPTDSITILNQPRFHLAHGVSGGKLISPAASRFSTAPLYNQLLDVEFGQFNLAHGIHIYL